MSVSDAGKKADLKYKNSKWRPNVMIEKEKRVFVENYYHERGFSSFNEWVNDIVEKEVLGKKD